MVVDKILSGIVHEQVTGKYLRAVVSGVDYQAVIKLTKINDHLPQTILVLNGRCQFKSAFCKGIRNFYLSVQSVPGQVVQS